MGKLATLKTSYRAGVSIHNQFRCDDDTGLLFRPEEYIRSLGGRIIANCNAHEDRLLKCRSEEEFEVYVPHNTSREYNRYALSVAVGMHKLIAPKAFAAIGSALIDHVDLVFPMHRRSKDAIDQMNVFAAGLLLGDITGRATDSRALSGLAKDQQLSRSFVSAQVPFLVEHDFTV